MFSGIRGAIFTPCVNGKKNVFISAVYFQQINKEDMIQGIMMMFLMILVKVFMISKNQIDFSNLTKSS
jgi:hypothetical protein